MRDAYDMNEPQNDDLGPEFAVVREALSMENFANCVAQLDHLFALALRATAADRARWEDIATAYGASVTKVIDLPGTWDEPALASLSNDERLAWLARALFDLALSYYGWQGDGLKPVAGNDIYSPGGLARALLDMSERSAED
jgi:hypothetical protein